MGNKIKVLIQVNEQSLITAIGSDIFIADPENWIVIDAGEGDRFAHAQANYLEQSLHDEQGRNNYIHDGAKIRLLTDEEKADLFPNPEVAPSFEELQTDFNLDVDYRLSCIELGLI